MHKVKSSFGVIVLVCIAVLSIAFNSPVHGEAIVVNFDADLAVLVTLGGSSYAPTSDRNNDGMLNGEELALIAAILADDTLPIHNEVYDAYINNFNVIHDDIIVAAGSFGAENLAAIARAGGAWLLWGDWEDEGVNRRFRTTFWNTSNDGAYNQIFGENATAIWNAAAAQIQTLGHLVAQDGDANGDGITNQEHYNAVSGDRAAYLAAALEFPLEPIIVDFDAALQIMNQASGDSSLLPGSDRNQDGIPNGDELALIAAILADTSLPIHEEVREAYETNYALIFADLDPATPVYGAAVIEAFSKVGAAWMLWGDWQEGGSNVLLRTVYKNNSGDGAYDLIYENNAGAVWDATAAQLQTVGHLVSQTGDANDDGTSNLGHYTASAGNRTLYIAAALNFSGTIIVPPVEGLPAGSSFTLGLLALLLAGCAAYQLRRKCMC